MMRSVFLRVVVLLMAGSAFHLAQGQTMTFNTAAAEPGFTFTGWGWWENQIIYPLEPNVNGVCTIEKNTGCWNITSFGVTCYAQNCAPPGGGTWRVFSDQGHERTFTVQSSPQVITLNWTNIHWFKMQLINSGNGNPNNTFDFDNVVYTVPVYTPAATPSLTLGTNPGCPGTPVNINVSGALNSADQWALYTGSCGGTLVTTTAGSSFTVSPFSTTAYYVRGIDSHGCVLPGSCSTITIAMTDTDGDGLANCQDPCPNLANLQNGNSCNDGNACTINDVVANCVCAGTFQDTDGDGTCDANDPCPSLAFLQNGDPCDDTESCTINDVVTNCFCMGTFQDTDEDGSCDAFDPCPDLAGLTNGSSCDDGDPCTINDVVANCACAGTFQDTDADGVCNANDPCPALAFLQNGDPCDDGDVCTTNDVVAGCLCAGTFQDSDEDDLCDANDSCPNAPGAIGGACDDGNEDTTGDVITEGCTCEGTPVMTCTQDLTLEFTVGASGTLPDWELRAEGTNMVVQSGTGFSLPTGTVFPVNTCLPDGNFYLVVSGAMGTGGGYVLRTSGNPGTRIVDNTANYVTGATSQVSTSDGVQIPLGTNSLIYTSCDKYYWKTGEYIVANEDTDVSGQYGVTMTTSGYEFWIYGPNGGYSFRKLRNHADADMFAPANALRACHMKINNWAAANHVPQDQLMNVRVRGVVAGVPKAWGPACRFVRNEALAACPPTKLMDIPGNPYVSCGATRAFLSNTANRIHARPVSGAGQYQFRFSLPGEGGTIVTRQNTAYYINLGWNPAQSPILQNGVTYDVQVRAMVNGVWCVWGEVCKLTICNTPPCGGSAQGGSQNSLLESDATISIWPNPNRGDQLFVSLTSIEDGTNTIGVELHDMTGKLMLARTYAASGEASPITVGLGNTLASGLYVVTITTGAQVHTERLVVE